MIIFIADLLSLYTQICVISPPVTTVTVEMECVIAMMDLEESTVMNQYVSSTYSKHEAFRLQGSVLLLSVNLFPLNDPCLVTNINIYHRSHAFQLLVF